ncbi:MAG: hypothetical protein VKL39_17840 [Leptolyngbyaceae bacterium]|nr:hypothetical protein [Leptolyngbyaceae bacterium]
MVAILAATYFFAVHKFDRFAVLHGPEILTTMGIFGCFMGIALALLKFETANITASVPLLLDGVKTAFWASVCGVGGALVIKARQRFSKTPIPVAEGEPKAASLEDVVHSITSLKKSISGDDDSSLINQLKLMRSEQADASRALRTSLDDFANKVSELGSKALIEALEKVIRDFNTQLNEQFGENFKQLNAAVEKLVVWQQQYKEELDRLGAVQKQAADDLKKSADAFTVSADRADAYTLSAQRLGGMLEAFKSQYETMRSSQEALASVLTEMKSVEPSFSAKLEDLTSTFKTSTNTLTAELQTQIKALTSQIQSLTTDFSASTKKQVEDFGDLLKATIPQIQQGVNSEIANTNRQLRENFETLDKNLERELEKALTTMGQQLASLSEKFVRDYTPLTDRLRDVVNMTKGV